MNKNYYELLEIDRNASKEIIEKAYKTLAKKYHPDLQDEAHKKSSEEIFKKINEAYETLSNPTSRAIYDKTLEDSSASTNNYDEIYKQNQVLKNELNNLKNQQSNINISTDTQNIPNSTQNISDDDYYNELKKARQRAYHDAYVEDLKRRGYKIKYKKTFSDYCKNFISLLCVILILYIIWHIPFVKNYFLNLYNNNVVFKSLTDLVMRIFNI